MLKTIEILDAIGHRIELGQIPDEDLEVASAVIESLALTGEAVTPLLVAHLQAFLAQSGIRLATGGAASALTGRSSPCQPFELA